MEALAALPWPNVRGKRCLAVVSPADVPLADALDGRGAREVVMLDPRGDLVGELVRAEPFDVVVAGRVIAGSERPLDVAQSLHHATHGVLVSWEPIDLVLSLTGRGRPLYTLDAEGNDGAHVGFNGAGHRHLLELAGFAVERISKPFVEPAPVALSPLRRVALRALTKSSATGVLHRGLLARPVR